MAKNPPDTNTGIPDSTAAEQPTIAPDATVLPCMKWFAVVVTIIDEMAQPVADVIVQIAKDAGNVMRLKTDADGAARFEGLEEGSYDITLPRLDCDTWELVSEKSLPQPESTMQATWSQPQAEETKTIEHTVVRGDCMASIAFDSGFLPESLWQLPENAALKSERKSMNILHPDDVVIIPPPRANPLEAATGMHYTLRRKGVPEKLRIRFVDFFGRPRAGIPYLLTIATADGTPVRDRKGSTDNDGMIQEPIPPNAVSGRIFLDEGDEQEEIEYDLGYVNPLDELSGIQARLNNLHYNSGSENGELDEPTRAALALFQQHHNLPVTGEPDDATKAKLEELHSS